jgi:hypothetical protein
MTDPTTTGSPPGYETKVVRYAMRMVPGCPVGPWVRYSDYAALAAEVEKLRRHLEAAEDDCAEYREEAVRLREELENLKYQQMADEAAREDAD